MEETKVVASEEAVAQEEAVAKEAEAVVEQADGEAEARESSDTVAMPPPQVPLSSPAPPLLVKGLLASLPPCL